MKTCKDCGEEKPLTDFYPRRSRSSPDPYCRPCRLGRNTLSRQKPESIEKRRAYDRAYHAEHGDRKLAKRYGIDPAVLVEFRRTHSACAICGSTENLHVDHDHDTNEIRDVLCHHCNTGLGLFREDPEIIRAAIDYLEAWDARRILR